MKNTIKKYSSLIRPLGGLLDILTINLVLYYFSNQEYLDFQFISYISFSWLLIAFYTKFYRVYRYTHVIRIFILLASQFFIFLLSFFAYFAIFDEEQIIGKQPILLLILISTITFVKFSSFFLLKKYRLIGKNFRNVIVFGNNKSAKNVGSIFSNRRDLGYRFLGFFSDKESTLKTHLGTIKEGFQFALKNPVDEIYCEINSVTKIQLKEMREFSSKHKIEFRLIPENQTIYSKNFILEYLGTIPILKPKQLAFEKRETHIIKRIFDIIFSLIICFFLISWLFPILWFLVKINSKGTFFFKQIRDGVNGKQFYCYKIRSMKINEDSDKIHTSKNDHRVTKIGSFLRKTSIDELPQFFNVLKGEMSVVGPRPHMNVQSLRFEKVIDKYIERHAVKPGITGLAQISGYRGEIVEKSDINNRVRLDIFYIENWSFFLDVKIIFQTILNVFKGEKKAY
ncbi:MAG: putative colanic acid biosynthesis UDP-glucose lipid carrier transferase [Flavobacteriaceae bacterium]|jgi:putative colanic acid biosynthesis UDP-glucose lipid carrier transferase